MTLLLAAYAIIGAFYAGATRIQGEMQWLGILPGEGKRLPLSYYKYFRPLVWFIAWPAFHLWFDLRVLPRR